jgi:hypothetical protein
VTSGAARYWRAPYHGRRRRKSGPDPATSEAAITVAVHATMSEGFGTDRADRRTIEEQTGKRQVVVVAREILGRTLPFVVPRESAAIPLIRHNVASGTTIHADESNAWDTLHASYPMLGVNHSREFKSEDGACTSEAESWFSRLRRAEFGIHHRISGQYLYQYANEMAWRHDARREPNGLHFRRVTQAALRHPESDVWRGYWQWSAA